MKHSTTPNPSSTHGSLEPPIYIVGEAAHYGGQAIDGRFIHAPMIPTGDYSVLRVVAGLAQPCLTRLTLDQAVRIVEILEESPEEPTVSESIGLSTMRIQLQEGDAPGPLAAPEEPSMRQLMKRCLEIRHLSAPQSWIPTHSLACILLLSDEDAHNLLSGMEMDGEVDGRDVEGMEGVEWRLPDFAPAPQSPEPQKEEKPAFVVAENPINGRFDVIEDSGTLGNPLIFSYASKVRARGLALILNSAVKSGQIQVVGQ